MPKEHKLHPDVDVCVLAALAFHQWLVKPAPFDFTEHDPKKAPEKPEKKARKADKQEEQHEKIA